MAIYIKKWGNYIQSLASVDTRDLPLDGDTCNQPPSKVYFKEAERDGKSAELPRLDYSFGVVVSTLGVR